MLAKAEGLGGMTEDALRRQTEWNEGLVRKGGLEPPRYCYRQPLKLVRLPIPPLPQVVPGLGPDFLSKVLQSGRGAGRHDPGCCSSGWSRTRRLTTTCPVLPEPARLQVLRAPRVEPLQVPPEPLVPQQEPARVRSEERCSPAPTTRCHRADP